MFTAPTLQVLWSSKVKFVSLSRLLGRPLFGSNSGLFTAPGFTVSPVGKEEKKGKEGRRNKKGKDDRRKELKKKVGQKKRRNLGGKEEKKREKKEKKSSAGFKQVKLVLLVFLSVKREGVGGGISFTFLPS